MDVTMAVAVAGAMEVAGAVDVWNIKQQQQEHAVVSPRFTGNSKKKREFGGTLWSKDGLKYYNICQKQWRKSLKGKDLLVEFEKFLDANSGKYGYLKSTSHSLKREHETSSDEVESSTIPTAPTVPTLRFEDEDTDEEEEGKEKEGEEDEKDGEDEAFEENPPLFAKDGSSSSESEDESHGKKGRGGGGRRGRCGRGGGGGNESEDENYGKKGHGGGGGRGGGRGAGHGAEQKKRRKT
jgi:hypothetical protein